MKRILVVSLLLVASLARAQEPTGAGEIVKGWLDQALAYVAENGSVGTGYGISVDTHTKGILLSQAIDVAPLSVKFFRTEVVPGIQHATLFSWNEENPDRELVGLSLKWHWFSAPPWVETVQEKPVVQTVIWPKLSEWYIKPSINYAPDKLVEGTMNAKWLIFGAEVMFKF